MKKTTIMLLMALAAATTGAQSQRTATYSNAEREFDEGRQLYDLKNYGAAYSFFDDYIEKQTEKERCANYCEAEYYRASCAYSLGQKRAARLLGEFLRDDPASAHCTRVRLMMGITYYNEEKYVEAADSCFAKADPQRLDRDERDDYHFYYGYCQMQCGRRTEARQNFEKVRPENQKSGVAAQYYTAYLCYLDGDYDAALPKLVALQEDPAYGRIVPYYLAQIYHTKGMHDKVLEYGLELVKKNSGDQNNAEIYRLIGESYYHQKDYAKAAANLLLYEQKSKQIYRNDAYMLGVALCKTEKYAEAIERLKKATVVTDDEMAQNAYLYLGACALKTGDKNTARLSFEAAQKLNFNADIKEEALYNYALVMYEQGYSPFNESVTAFEKFLTAFPESKYTEQVYKYLVNVYLTTKNYKQAYESMQRIKDPAPSLRAARQKIVYSLGIEAFRNGDMESAVAWLGKSLEDRQSSYQLEAEALLWRGEAYYRQGDYDMAKKDLTEFIGALGSHNTQIYNLGHYDLGYCNFMQKDYSEALEWFRKYINLEDSNKQLVADANNRIGDCYFYARDLDNAAKNYEKVYSLNGPGADYACFQKGFIQGLQKDNQGKIVTLERLVNTYKQSELLPDANYEIGRAYMLMGQNTKAIEKFNELNRSYFHSPLARKGRLQIAMIYDDMGKTGDAIKVYKQIVDLYPNSEESRTSLESMKQIYVDQNKVGEYAEYVSSLGGIETFSASEEDSLTYLAAEKAYTRGEYATAVQSLKAYLAKFPKSANKATARLNLAHSLRQTDKREEAKSAYAELASALDRKGAEGKGEGKKEAKGEEKGDLNGNDTEAMAPDAEAGRGSWQAVMATVWLADMEYQDKEYAKAAAHYKAYAAATHKPEQRQKALMGMLRCTKETGNADSTIAAANTVLALQGIDAKEKREALYLRAKAYEAAGATDKAQEDYTVLKEDCQDRYGAEAEYRIAQYLFHEQKADKAEEEIFAFIEKNTPHQYWLAKAFILLSDIYISQGKDFDAKQYLLSLQENYTGQGDTIGTEIKARLDDINDREANQVKQ